MPASEGALRFLSQEAVRACCSLPEKSTPSPPLVVDGQPPNVENGATGTMVCAHVVFAPRFAELICLWIHVIHRPSSHPLCISGWCNFRICEFSLHSSLLFVCLLFCLPWRSAWYMPCLCIRKEQQESCSIMILLSA